uniref:FP protein C-terminal domain-containing protein n=2 Tax=Cacopsylla melanoneura TaxID=428564 RepID=A0A8D8QXV8_9HEMI
MAPSVKNPIKKGSQKKKEAIVFSDDDYESDETVDIDLDKMNTKEIVKKIYRKMGKYDEMLLTIQQLKLTVLENKNDIEMLKKKLGEKETENSKLKKRVDQQDNAIGDINQRQRLINIVVNGIEEKKGENVEEIVAQLGKDLDIPDAENQIQVAHRVPSATTPSPIVVRMLNSKTRDVWVKAARDKKLREKKIYINEHLSPRNYKLFKSVKEWAKENRHKYVWTKDCRIMMRKDDNSKVKFIKSMDDLSSDSGNRVNTRSSRF